MKKKPMTIIMIGLKNKVSQQPLYSLNIAVDLFYYQ